VEIIENENETSVEQSIDEIAGDDDQSVNGALANLGVDEENESIMVELGVDQIACILSFLPPWVIMCARCVSKNWREAATITIVPPVDFRVNSVEKYNAMTVMTRALPNLQQITIGRPGNGHKWSDGEDPDEEYAARTANRISVDIGIISNFSKLRILVLVHYGFNGRYPFLFSSFPLLQNLTIFCCYHLKLDLGMLAELPSLKELNCSYNYELTGNINSLRVFKDTLKHVEIQYCDNVEGNFMDLADFPHLKMLDLVDTAVTGDIRDIGEHDFSSLELLFLPDGVYEFQHIVDGPDLIRTFYHLKKQRPALKMNRYGALSKDSPDWYEGVDDIVFPPLWILFVEAGSRIGYRWGTEFHEYCCEVNWLDPEPDSESSAYGDYVKAMRELESQKFYGGFHEPPTEEVFHRLWGEEVESDDSET
jgi:hypothetical protein